jgi:aerotaxis receptor
MKKNLPVTGKEVHLSEDDTIISTTDLKGLVTYANKDFIKISGFSEEELMGKNHNIVRHPDMPVVAFKHLWDTVKGNNPWRGVVKNRCKNGDHYWVEAFVTPVTDINNNIVGYQSVRSRPSREQIAAAEALYIKLNKKEITALPTKFRLRDVSVMKRMTVALLVAAVLPLISILLWKNQLISEALMSGLAFTSPVIIIFSLLLINNTLIKPLKQTIKIAKGIAGGNLQQNIVADNNDEVGELLMSMKLMQARLQTVIGRLTEVSSEVAQDALMLSTSSDRTFEMMSKQQLETELVATAMHEMTATISEVAQNTEYTAHAAGEANSNSDNGKLVVSKVRDSIGRLVKEVENSADTITELEAKSDDIQSIMSVIHSIADQTNLLALNAAIEAARAG